MGTKTPVNVKEKRTLIPCEECPREFMTTAALKSHTSAKHPEKYKQMQKSSDTAVDEKKTAFVPPTSRASKRLLQKKSVDKQVEPEITKPNSDINRKIIFECPRCPKVFQVYFSAHKHIQKRHCEDEDGKPVLCHSPNLIKPIRKEMCGVCSKTINGIHNCGDVSGLEEVIDDSTKDSSQGTYSCLGCKRNFKTLALFDRHVLSSHSGNVETMFFASFNEFMFWKTDIETQVKLKYQELYKTPQKQYYHCNYVSTKNSADITHLCPSIIITKTLPKGIQVDFQKQHFEHTCDYVTPKQYEEFIITKDSAFDSIKTDDLYIKLKNILKDVIIGAANIDPTNLKKLFNMANEMQSCLNSIEQTKVIKKKQFSVAFDPERESSININNKDAVESETTDKENTNKSMTDDQITKVLEPSRVSARLKRKSETSSPVPKKKIFKNEVKGLKENNNITKDIIQSPKFNSRSPISQSPSFNDSYKQFIDSTFKVDKKDVSSNTIKDISSNTKKDVSSNTKKDFSSNTKKDVPSNTKKDVSSSIKKDISSNIKKDVSSNTKKVSSPATKKVCTLVFKKDTNNEASAIKKESLITTKKESPLNTRKSSPNTKKVKKDVVKTKMGQFSPEKKEALRKPLREESEIDKKTSETDVKKKPLQNVDVKKKQDNVIIKKNRGSIKSPTKSKVADLSLDRVEFEVVEQENDCNILVLKI